MGVDDELYAAVDLGSNSFHLLLARRAGERFETVERAKEKVQLLAGFAGGELHPQALARGEACLTRFAQRLAAVPREHVQMVGTHALREAGNREAFAAAAQRIVGVPLEVVSGEEEGRLVYLGVSHHLSFTAVASQPQPPHPQPHLQPHLQPLLQSRLVVDIGGGSTELAWGDSAAAPDHVASFKVGCVALKDWHFSDGGSQGQAFQAARCTVLDVLGDMRHPGVDEVIGTSGTVESVQGVLAANGWGSARITRAGLSELTEAIVSGRWLVDAGLPGLPPERVDIFPAGLAVVDALFEVLQLESMRFVDASLQDGLLGRLAAPPAGDLREDSVRRLQDRFRVDRRQAARVRASALALFDAVAPWFGQPDRRRAVLGWAADLHEVGKAVSVRHYHRHGAYLLANSDLRSFSGAERNQLGLMIRGHRRAFPGLALRAVSERVRDDLLKLLALLRLAVIVNRSHTDADHPALDAQASERCLTLLLPAGWLAAHPLSAKELTVETEQLASAGLELRVEEAAP